MATTEELLAQLEAEAQSETPVCIIDPDTRTITVPPEYQLLGVENDKRVERIYFQCPKIVGDNQDLSRDYILFINYVNANGDPDAYKINDMQVEGDNITFSWLLEEKVTLYQGDIQISFCGIIPGDEQEDPDKNRWGTTINTDCTCLVGLKCTQQVAESNPDAIAQIWAAIDELKAGGGGGGTPGKDGVGIDRIEKTSTQGLVDTYTIYLTDDRTYTFTVTNGKDGNPGEKGDPGEDGITPTIGENGNWYLGETDTGKPSRGEKGDPGEQGPQGPKGPAGATPNIRIGTVQTLDPGQQATASMSGTPENPLLNLGIPKGEQGENAESQNGIPSGGTAGQVLAKKTNTDYDVEWTAVEGGDLSGIGWTSEQVAMLETLGQYLVYTDQTTGQSILDGLISSLRESSGGTTEPGVYTITKELTNVTIDNESASVISGSVYAASLTASEGYYIESVTITMGGENITQSAYSEGKINIGSVTGNIVIIANGTLLDNLIKLSECTSGNERMPDGSIVTEGELLVTPFVKVNPDTIYKTNINKNLPDGSITYSQKIFAYGVDKDFKRSNQLEANVPYGEISNAATREGEEWVRILFSIQNENPYFGLKGIV